MAVSMMDIRKMNVLVNHHFVPVWMGMRLATIPHEIVCMLMMYIMAVSVSMVDCAVSVLMFVSLAHVQPEACRHECSGDTELQGDSVAKKKHREERAKEWSDRKISAGPRGSQVS